MSSTFTWRKAASCESSSCVLVATSPRGVFVRDSKDPGPVLAFGKPDWVVFLDGLRGGEFDRTGVWREVSDV